MVKWNERSPERGNNLSSSVEIRKHIASQGSAGVVSTVGAEQDA